MKIKIAISLSILVALFVGFVAGVAVSVRGYEKFVIKPARIGMANTVSTRINELSLLRVGQTQEAIDEMERMLDLQTDGLISQISAFPGKPVSEITRVLQQIRAYREIYPSSAPRNPRIETAFSSLEPFKVNSECGAAFCKLVALRDEETSTTLTRP